MSSYLGFAYILIEALSPTFLNWMRELQLNRASGLHSPISQSHDSISHLREFALLIALASTIVKLLRDHVSSGQVVVSLRDQQRR